MAPLRHLGLSDSDRFSGSPTTSSTTGLRTWNNDGFLILEREDGYYSVRKQPSRARQHHHGGRRKSLQQQHHNVKSRSKSNGRYYHGERRGSSSRGHRHHLRDHGDEQYEEEDDDNERHHNRPTHRSSSSFNAPKPRRGYQQILDASSTDSSTSTSCASSASPRDHHHNHRHNNKHHHHQHQHRSRSHPRRRSSYHSSSGRSSSRNISTKREKVDSSTRSLPRRGQGGGRDAPTKLDSSARSSSSRHDRGHESSRDHNNPAEGGDEIDSSNRSASRTRSIRVDGEDAMDSSIRSSSSKHHHRVDDGEIDSSTRSTSSRNDRRTQSRGVIEEYDDVLAVDNDDVLPEGDEEANYNSSALVVYNPTSTARNRYDIPPEPSSVPSSPQQDPPPSSSAKVVLALDPPPVTSSSKHQHHGVAPREKACDDNSEPSFKPLYSSSTKEEVPSSTEEGSSFNDTDRTVKYDNMKQATITKYKQMYDDMLENQSVFEVVRGSSRRRSSTTTTTTEGRSSSTSKRRDSSTNKHQHHVGDSNDDPVEQYCSLVVRKSVKRTDTEQDSHHGGGGGRRAGCGGHGHGRRSSNHDSGGRERSISKKRASKETEHDSPMVQRVSIVTTGSSENSNQEGTAENKESVSIVLDMIDGMEMRREITFSGKEPDDSASDGIPKLTHSPGSSDDESPKTMELQIVPRVKKQEEEDLTDDKHRRRSDRRRCSSGSKYSCSSSNDRRSCSRGRRSSSNSRSSQSRIRSSSGGSIRSSSNGSTKEIDMKQSQPKTTKGPMFFRTIKKIASKVKNTLTELGGIHSVHKYSEGEMARYKIGKAPKTLVHYDSETKTVEVKIVAVHLDAVLEIPYYTIQLPNKTRKRTSWDNLMTLAEYRKIKSTHVSGTEHNGKAGVDGNGELTSGSRRSRSLSRLTSRLRGSSSQGQQEQDRQRQRSTSRNNRLRSSSNGRYRGDNHSVTSASSRRSQSPYKSSRSHSSSRRSSSRRRGEHLGRSNSSQRGNHGRPRSQSPFQRFIEDGKSKKKEEEEHYIRGCGRRHRSHSNKGRQILSSRHPMDSLTSIMAVAEDSSSRHGGKTNALGELVSAPTQQQQQRRRSSSGSPPYIKSCYLVKDGNIKDCKEGEGSARTVVNNSRQQELNASCGTLIVVEDVTGDSDDDELFSIEK